MPEKMNPLHMIGFTESMNYPNLRRFGYRL